MVIDTSNPRRRRQQRRGGFYIPSPLATPYSSSIVSTPLLLEEDGYDDEDSAVFDARVSEKRPSLGCIAEDDDGEGGNSIVSDVNDDRNKEMLIRNVDKENRSFIYDNAITSTISTKTTIEYDDDGNVNVILVEEPQRVLPLSNDRAIQMTFDNDELQGEEDDDLNGIYDMKNDDNETIVTASISSTSSDDDTIATVEERTILESALLESALLESALQHLELEEDIEHDENERNFITGVIVERLKTPELSSSLVEGIILSNSPDGNEIIMNRCW